LHLNTILKKCLFVHFISKQSQVKKITEIQFKLFAMRQYFPFIYLRV